MTEIKTVNISSKRQITLPKSCTQFKEGGKAIIFAKEDKIIIKPVKDKIIAETMILAEKSLEDCWNSQEDEKAFLYLQDE